MHKDTIQYGQEYSLFELKDINTGDIPPIWITLIITMNYIQTNFAIKDNKIPAIQTNSDCLYGW